MSKPSQLDPFIPPRRRFLQRSATFAAAAATASFPALGVSDCAPDVLPPAFAALKPLGSRVRPITPEEFRARIEKAQKLMNEAQPKFDALFLAPGTGLYYFSGIRWWPSERLLALIIPRSGEPIIVVPTFEEGRMRERLKFPAEVRVWQEDEIPTKIAAAALADRGIRTGRVGIDETTFFTFYDHFRSAAPGLECVSADPITIACRGIKSAHELELMRLACEATFDVFRATFASLKLGISQDEINNLIEAGFVKMGLRGGALVLIGASAALPHGTIKPATLKEGDVVLIDGGTNVEGYDSDVTRTGVVIGKPSEKVARVYEIVRKAQDAALDAGRAGRLSGTVDDAARAVIASSGFGPDYKFLTHRLGHGIGLDGHEHPYLVRGSKTVLAPGMTFSNEPGIYIPGEFGLRCEDDMVIATDGPAQLLTAAFQVSLEKPLG
ncbi:MAG TPA: Xaa-Pro peptidase family protein [Candidatus Dormibacteraeota bacterium]|nr:Xaa-Pro peptidase family protein [Candidatus Dormibacteraeota bacterium]